MAILDEWIADLPQQFQSKENIETLIRTFSKQIEELLDVFRQLDTQTDLESAVGTNLDMVGDIVTLTRKEAGILAGIDIEDPVISDERYRQFLKYQMLVNTNECTYHDLMQSIEILWNTDNMHYVEDPERPATILIRLQTMSVDVLVDPLAGKIMAIKPAGVALIYTITYTVFIDFRHIEEFIFRDMHLHTAVPFWRTRYFDGSEIMDGSHLMDAMPAYDMRLGVSCGIGRISAKEQFALTGVSARMAIMTKEHIHMSEQTVLMAIDIWRSLFLSESVLKVKVAVSSMSSVREEFGNGTIRTQRHLAYFDGSLLVDGSHLMDSFIREEEI